ncbi:MAG TPA: MauE/DoxX family redox-associated membrane protein [Pyrinomonadaceae bacterium]|nr:MauE/DoxX family redox-associated membrane protein [Pyrinomonadaceae bacterium]
MNNEGVGAPMHTQTSDNFTVSPRRRVSVSVLKWLVHISRFGLAALFLFTAGAKLAIVRDFAGNVAQLVSASGFDYTRWTWPATIAVIVVEVITTALLLVPKTVRIGALCAAALLLGFAAFALYYVYGLHGEPLECGCFGGIIGSQLGVKTALRNLGLLIPALLVFFGYRHRTQPSSPPTKAPDFLEGSSVNQQT